MKWKIKDNLNRIMYFFFKFIKSLIMKILIKFLIQKFCIIKFIVGARKA